MSEESEPKKFVFYLTDYNTKKHWYDSYTVTHDKRNIVVEHDPDRRIKKKFELTTFGEYGQYIPCYDLTFKKFDVYDFDKDEETRKDILTGCYELRLLDKTMNVPQRNDIFHQKNLTRVKLKSLTLPDHIMEYLKQIGYGERNGWKFETRSYDDEVTVKKQIPVEKLEEYNEKMERINKLLEEVNTLGTFKKMHLAPTTEDFIPNIDYSTKDRNLVGVKLSDVGFTVYGFIGDALYQHVMSKENFKSTIHVTIRELEHNKDALTNTMVLLKNETVYDPYDKCFRDLYGEMTIGLYDKCYKFYLGDLDFNLELEKVRKHPEDNDSLDIHPLARLFDPEVNMYSGKKYSNYILGFRGDNIYEYALDHYPVLYFV